MLCSCNSDRSNSSLDTNGDKVTDVKISYENGTKTKEQINYIDGIYDGIELYWDKDLNLVKKIINYKNAPPVVMYFNKPHNLEAQLSFATLNYKRSFKGLAENEWLEKTKSLTVYFFKEGNIKYSLVDQDDDRHFENISLYDINNRIAESYSDIDDNGILDVKKTYQFGKKVSENELSLPSDEVLSRLEGFNQDIRFMTK